MANGNVRLLAALCSLLILATFIGSTQSTSCCLKYVRRPLRCNLLLGYTIHTINASCDLSAIVFHTAGRFVCADPSKRWTQKAMKCVDEKKKRNVELIQKEAPGIGTFS